MDTKSSLDIDDMHDLRKLKKYSDEKEKYLFRRRFPG